MPLKPQNIVQAAEADLKRRALNVEIDNDRRNGYNGKFHQYAFHRDHVNQASDVRDLITRAIESPPKLDPIPMIDKKTHKQKVGLDGRLKWKNVNIKKSIKQIYGDLDVVRAAHALLEDT